jgi:WD40 repeat protein
LDGRHAISASDKTLQVWDLSSGRKLRTLKGHHDWVRFVAVTPDGQHAVSASDDRTLKVWDLDTGHELRTLKGHSHSITGVAVAPSGKHVVSTSYDNTLKVWDLGSSLALATFTYEAEPYCCAFVDETRIVGGDAGGRIYVLKIIESQ